MSPDRTYEMEADHSSSALADPAKSTASLSALLHAGLGVPSPFLSCAAGDCGHQVSRRL